MKVIGLDVGFGNTKSTWKGPYLGLDGGKQTWGELCFPSVAHPALVDDTKSGMAGSDRVLVKAESQSFYVGPRATLGESVRALSENFIETEEYDAILTGAIAYSFRRGGEATETLDVLVLGLPMSRYLKTRARLKEIGQKTRKVPTGGIPRGNDFIDVRVKQVFVVPQPYGALRFASEQNHELFDDSHVSLIVDQGYNTLDWFVARGMRPQLDLCGSFSGGMSHLLRKIGSAISSAEGVELPNLATVEAALISGSLNAGHKLIDMSPYRELASAEARSTVSEFLQLFNPARNNISQIALSGGGARFFAPALRDRLSAYRIDIIEEPVMANSRGFWLHGMDTLHLQAETA